MLPGAPIKLFMTASTEVRAQRRFVEQQARGVQGGGAVPGPTQSSPDFQSTLQAISERDRRDETRATAPTRQAEDAVLCDTSHMSLDEVIDQVEELCRVRLNLPRAIGQDMAGEPSAPRAVAASVATPIPQLLNRALGTDR